MIQFLEYPAEKQVLLDGNNTVIKVISTNGVGYYFIAKIYVDGVLFDTQGWSREDNYTAKKDLIYLYYAYFKSEFPASFVSGVPEQTHLKKPVYIILEEYDFDTDTLQQSVTSPVFFIMHSAKPDTFDNTYKLKLLNAPTNQRNHAKGKIVVPFFANTNNEIITIELINSENSILNTHTIPANSLPEKRVFLYNFDLSTLTIPYTISYLTLKITIGIVVEKISYTLIHLPNYPIKEIRYQNNYGFFLPAYFDGDLESNIGFKVESYEDKSEQKVIYNIDLDGSYTINCGNLNNQQCGVITEVSKSLKTYFYNNNQYLAVNTATKKTTDFKDRQNIYAQDLQFTFKKEAPISNIGLKVDSVVTEEPAFITINNVERPIFLATTYYKIFFTKNRNPNLIQIEFITHDDFWVNLNNLQGVTSPVIFDPYAPGVNGLFLNLKGFRLKYIDNLVTIYSNTYVFN